MLGNLKIGPRLIALIAVQTLILVVTGVTALVGLNLASRTTGELNEVVSEQVRLSALTQVVRGDLLAIVNGVERGSITWAQASDALQHTKAKFEQSWQTYASGTSSEEQEAIDVALMSGVDAMRDVFSELDNIIAAEDRGLLSLYVLNDFDVVAAPFLQALQARVDAAQTESETAFAQSLEQARMFLGLGTMIVAAGALIAGLLGFLIYRSIARPIAQVTATLDEVAQGNYYARTGLQGRDELAELGRAFDRLLEDRVSALVKSTEENERLNASVIDVLQAVAQLSQRDLTVKVPVTEDVTGPVADALNLMTSETSKVLRGVQRISHQVSEASALVKEQSDVAIAAATSEQQEIQRTALQLTNAAEAMLGIAKLAQNCQLVADKAIKTTETAQDTVMETVKGMGGIRDTIRETEKRIKRLGERSQEISGVVNLINSIAERTHILALNASMHAASAGEAGRGFAVVADEVQRLAENARQATSEIATLVSNVQTETADTVNTMNETITQVVDGSRLAEDAGERMQDTQSGTAELVSMVRQIAVGSRDQARSSQELVKRARRIHKTSLETNEQLREQTAHTIQLVEYAQGLLQAVSVFRLPEAADGKVTPLEQPPDAVVAHG